ncbi:Contains PF/01426 BAH (bromo-adjacent homology) domain. ESTs gb/N96349, gb/T42710, gb/H77084, gb/AA395147 and gb/AA605500 come from this gene [Arabidopsis thaliana]|uniref:F24J5.18 protein n=1 Tax=Arabidopsis thaliana TaxID=3702 RepID=Q9SX21_ARATH|nr:Contains PF/01426 BAH (bromo-adjacent homology) domain. ESTs gb/N96349, gb/T42710, gb/H77084, gb/AA395147 and gb/AA605500 come from this gene [Arabidopsis thaliana]
MAWSSETPSYCGWNERHVKNTKEKMEVHYYLERKDGIADLAVIGRLKNSKRMSFRYALKKNRSVLKKLNSKDDVALWLDSIVSGEIPHVADVPATVMTEKDAGGFNMSTFMNRKFQEPIQQIKTFSWMGFSWTCRKRPEQHKRLVAYIEDLYEDSKGKKMVVVRWFHKTEEVGSVLSDDDNDREIFFSLNRQDISIECIDYLATVLSPQHYEKFLKVPMHVQTVAFFCQKLYGDDGLKPYDITQLEGYWRQEMLRYLNVSILKSFEGAQAPGTDPGLKAPLVGCVGIRSRKRRRPSPVGTLNVSYAGDMKGDCKSSPDSVLAVTDASIFKGDEDGSSHHIKKGSLIEVLSEDSGIRGCWFKALVLKKHKDKVKVQYQDIQDADDESKKLEEWILTSRVAAGDHLGDLRIKGRKVVRPMLKPSKENDVCVIGVGMPVDVWWCDGWWEGIVVQEVSEEKFEVYLPGEKKMSAFHRNDLRQSREWLDDEWLNIRSRSDIVSSVLSLTKKKEMEVKHDEKSSDVGVCNGRMSPKTEAKRTISLPVATTKKSLPKRPIPDLLKDVLVTSDLKWKKSSRKRNRVVSCCPHDPSLNDGFSSERSLDCENCKFMEDTFGSSDGQHLTGLLMSR